MNKKYIAIVLIGLCFVFTLCDAYAEPEAACSYWNIFKASYLHETGRIIDTGNNGISHSEGQGVALLASVFCADKASFEKIWSWTQKNIQVRNDKLFAWRWEPSSNGGKVTDMNNATDGDILIAWALLSAHKLWGDSTYLNEAKLILEDIRKKLLVNKNNLLLLLPGENGFVKADGIILNLSYWIFPALQDFAKTFPEQKEWMGLQNTGIQLLKSARFGRWSLPPNWLFYKDQLKIADGFPPYFGYDAVRIPLYLVWGNLVQDDLLQPFRSFWSYFDGAHFLPAWTDLTKDSIDSYDACGGIHLIKNLVMNIPLKYIEDKNYYCASLELMTFLAYEANKQKNEKHN